MAVAKLVCGDCGAEIAAGDRRCPSCGGAIEPPGMQKGGVSVRCPACGHANPPSAGTCESCGGRLGKRPEARPGVSGRRSPAPGGKKFQSWHLFSGAAVLLLIAYLVYANLGEETRSGPSAGSPPVMAGPAGPHIHTADLAPLEEAVKTRPDDMDALLKLANALHDNGQWSRAIDAYGRYLRKNPANPDARVDLGICYFELSQVDSSRSGELSRRAVKEMEAVAAAFPNHQQAAFNLGIVLLNTGDLAGSNRWFTRAAEINGQSELGQRAKSILSQHSTLMP